MAGYSGTPLPQKLGIKPGTIAVVINAPDNYRKLLGQIPSGVNFATRPVGNTKFIHLFVKERLHPGILDGLARSGVQAVEIFAARQHIDYANRKAHVKEIADWFRGSGVPLNSVHSPLYSDYEWGRAGAPPVNVASIDRAARIEAMDEIKRALEIAEQIPFRFLVQHLGTPNESFSDKKFEAAMTSRPGAFENPYRRSGPCDFPGFRAGRHSAARAAETRVFRSHSRPRCAQRASVRPRMR